MSRRSLAVGLALLVLGLLLVGCRRDKEKKPDRFEVTTAVTPEQIGVQLYPKAQIAFSSGRIDHKKDSSTFSLTHDTTDSLVKVYDWYRKQLGGELDTDLLVSDGRDPQAKLIKLDGRTRTEVSAFAGDSKVRVVIIRRTEEAPVSSEQETRR